MRYGKSRILRHFLGLAVLIPGVGFAAGTYDEAQVVGVQPIYETFRTSVPVEQCRQEEVAHRPYRRASATGPLLGAIIGGAIGNAVGSKKRNKQVGTAVGALLGGSIGADVSRRRSAEGASVRYSTQQVCDVVYEQREEERLAGYHVDYVYGGTTYRTRMPRDPGDTLRVRVRVSPAE
ncbi:MAG: glycine zipper 2TM domain-containing protein [Pseudomonadota bacterium]